MQVAIGVDVGGSHISSGALRTDTFELLPGTYFTGKVDSHADKEHIFQNWSTTINRTIDALEGIVPTGLGFAMPGPFDYTEGIGYFEGNQKFESLYGVSVSKEFPAYLKTGMPIRFLNDASSFGVGSALAQGKLKEKRIVAITLGTGFGATFLEGLIPITDGDEVPEGGSLWNKEFGESIADDYFSTRWFLGRYAELTGDTTPLGVKELVQGEEETVRKLFLEFGANLSSFLLPHMQQFKPDLLVIGGNIARTESLFLPSLLEAWKEHGYSLPVEIIDRTEEAGIRGASYLFEPHFWEKVQEFSHNGTG